MTPEARIATSTMTLDKFERGRLAGMDQLPTIRDEMAILEATAMAHPRLTPEVQALVARWQRYLIRMKTGQ